MAARCPACNGCMKVRGSYFQPNGHGEVSALIRWFCKLCNSYFTRSGLGVPLEEVHGTHAGESMIGK